MCENANPIYRVESIDSDEYDVYDANLTEQQKYIKNEIVIISRYNIKSSHPAIHMCNKDTPFWKSKLFNTYYIDILIFTKDTPSLRMIECAKYHIPNMSCNIGKEANGEIIYDEELKHDQQILKTSDFTMESGIDFTKPITFNTDTLTIENINF